MPNIADAYARFLASQYPNSRLAQQRRVTAFQNPTTGNVQLGPPGARNPNLTGPGGRDVGGGTPIMDPRNPGATVPGQRRGTGRPIPRMPDMSVETPPREQMVGRRLAPPATFMEKLQSLASSPYGRELFSGLGRGAMRSASTPGMAGFTGSVAEIVEGANRGAIAQTEADEKERLKAEATALQAQRAGMDLNALMADAMSRGDYQLVNAIANMLKTQADILSPTAVNTDAKTQHYIQMRDKRRLIRDLESKEGTPEFDADALAEAKMDMASMESLYLDPGPADPVGLRELDGLARWMFGLPYSALNQNQRNQVQQAMGRTPPPTSYGGYVAAPDQEKTAEAWATENIEWATGGSQRFDKNLANFREVIQLLENQMTADVAGVLKLSGDKDDDTVSTIPWETVKRVAEEMELDGNADEPWTGMMIQKFPFLAANADSTAVQALDLVRSVVFQSLKETLGGQFAEREAENLVRAAYNPMLSASINLRRIKRLEAELMGSKRVKDAAMYWPSNPENPTYDPTSRYPGSMLGFNPEPHVTSWRKEKFSQMFRLDDYENLGGNTVRAMTAELDNMQLADYDFLIDTIEDQVNANNKLESLGTQMLELITARRSN